MSLYNDCEPDPFEALVYSVIERTANVTLSLSVEADDTAVVVVAVVSVVTALGALVCCLYLRLMKLVQATFFFYLFIFFMEVVKIIWY